MPALIAALWGAFIGIAGSAAGQVLVSLGMAVVTYTGMDISLDWLKAQAVSSMAGVGPEVLGLLGVMKVGECISIVTSAMVARQTAMGLKNGAVKKWATK